MVWVSKDAWPDTGTVPFRGEKGSAYEGGWRVPGIMWAPPFGSPGTTTTDSAERIGTRPVMNEAQQYNNCIAQGIAAAAGEHEEVTEICGR